MLRQAAVVTRLSEARIASEGERCDVSVVTPIYNEEENISRFCEQLFEGLYSYAIGGTAPEPGLATACDPSADSTVWTCHLREGVAFHNGATLDSGDVLLTYAMQWDAAHPLHVGQEGLFEYWSYLFAGYLNPPPAS